MSDEFDLKPGDAPMMLSASWWKNKLGLLRALSNIQVIEGGSYDAKISEKNLIITIKKPDAPNPSSSYQGEYDPTVIDYSYGDIVRVSPSNTVSRQNGGATVAGVYVCIKDSPGPTDYPKHPLSSGGETIHWQWLATWPQATIDCSNGDSISSASDSQAL